MVVILVKKAVFKKNPFWSILCLLCGLFLMGIFIFVYCNDSEATIGELLAGVAFGLLICLFSILNLFYNFRAYLYIDDGNIKGKYHYFGKIDCHILDVDFVLGRNGTLIIQLKDGKCHTIMGLENSWELCSLIRQNMTFKATVEPEKLIEELNQLKSIRKKWLIYTCSTWVLMVVNIFVTVFLTGERELHEFSKTDWKIFAIMGIIEFVTVIATFLFAQKTGKNNTPIEKLKYYISRTIVETKPLLPGNMLKVCTDENYTERIILFGFPNEDSIYYCVEELDGNYNLEKVYTSEIYEDIEHMPDGLEFLIDITEKFL